MKSHPFDCDKMRGLTKGVIQGLKIKPSIPIGKTIWLVYIIDYTIYKKISK